MIFQAMTVLQFHANEYLSKKYIKYKLYIQINGNCNQMKINDNTSVMYTKFQTCCTLCTML